MKRDYTDGVKDNVIFFTGVEIEKTPAYGLKTLFVVGTHDPERIIDMAKENGCQHVFVGANHSFDPAKDMAVNGFDLYDAMGQWDKMLFPLLKEGFLVSLDFDVRFVEAVLESGYNEYDNFSPQISVKIPYARHFNYNAMLKIDDKDFKASNPGVWCHPLNNLMGRDRFTDWRDYGKDEPL
jgi:hypothetical protein